MKKLNWLLGIFCVFLAVFCIILWQQKKAEHEKMEAICQSSVDSAFAHFATFERLQNESDYISGVAEFRSFMTAYLFLSDNEADTNYIWCNIVYGEMILHPENVKENIADLVNALNYLKIDYTHPNGYNRINALGTKLTHSGE